MSRLLPAEVASAFALGTRTGVLTIADRDAGWALFLTDLAEQYHVVDIRGSIWSVAHRLLFRYPLRAGDAIHVATALSVDPTRAEQQTFWTADRQQAHAAREEGLTVELLA